MITPIFLSASGVVVNLMPKFHVAIGKHYSNINLVAGTDLWCCRKLINIFKLDQANLSYIKINTILEI